MICWNRSSEQQRWLARLSIIVLWYSLLPAAGQSEPPVDPPNDTTKPQEAPEAADPPPTLDELLGLEGDETARDIAERQAEEELQRRLNEEEAFDGFAEALEKMALSAELLEIEFDTGLGTQRVQEEIIARLDALVDVARQQKSRASSSSSQSQSGSPSQDCQPGPRRDRGRSSNADGTNPAGGGAEPPLREENLNAVLDETRSEWGHLPQRVREMLLQGREERFSSLYERLTREYYRRLAEEGSR